MKDLYKTFAKDYDEFGKIEEYLGAEKEFFSNISKEHRVKTVLDCACGTGQHLYMLHELGLKVSGSDFSQAMLEKAGENLSGLGVDIPLAQCDFRYLETAFDERFDMVVCLTTSLPHLHNDEDLITALKSMKNRLNDGGVLVLTQGTTHYTLGLPAIEVVVSREDFSRVYIKERSEGILKINILDLFHSQERVENNIHSVEYKIILDEEYIKLLDTAGFSKVNVYGNYAMLPYDKNSKRLIVIGQC